MGLPNARSVIDKAHRLGRPNPKAIQPRHIIVRFTSHQAAEKTLARRRMLSGSGIWVKRHLPENIERQTSLLEKVLPMAKAKDSYASILPGNQLRFKQNTYDIHSIHRSGLPVHKLHERENENTIGFQGPLSPLSNFHTCSLNIEGTSYCSIEQYYQAEKAKRHNDLVSLSRILLETDPVLIKRLGKGIQKTLNVREDEENDNNIRVLEKGLSVKFREPRMKNHLLGTGSKVIAESSGYDLYYGTGKSLYDNDCLNISCFKGKNKMGKLLEKIRDSLKAGQEMDTK